MIFFSRVWNTKNGFLLMSCTIPSTQGWFLWLLTEWWWEPHNSYEGQLAFPYLSNGISTLVGVQAEASRGFLDSSFSHTHIQCINKSCYTFPSKYFQTGTTSYSLPSNHNHLGSGKHSLWTITNSLPNWSLFACLPLIQDQLQHKTQGNPLKI